MKHIFVIALSLFFSTVQAQIENNKIIIGTVDSIYSKILHEQRKVWVYKPATDPNSPYKQRFPVVYLLDGDAHFFSVMGMMQQLSEVNGNSLLPQMILVGIPNTDRTRDLTPTHVSSSPFGNSDFLQSSGGGENFTSFLEKELMPYIDSAYSAAPHRTLIGHSFGGLMVINTLLNHTNLFNSYIAIDPSMWWDNQKLLKQASSILSKKKFSGRSFYLGIANTMNEGMDTLMAARDTSNTTMHIRSILEFASVLKKSKGNDLRWSYKYYNDDDHGSVPLIAEYDAFRFMFNFYRLPPFQKLFDNNYKSDSLIVAHFKEVSKHMGYTILPPEHLVAGLGYAFMQNNMLDKTYTFFKMNLDNYPKSVGVYDSMGNYYNAKGDKKNAIEYYTKALALKDIPEIREKLKMLKEQK